MLHGHESDNRHHSRMCVRRRRRRENPTMTRSIQEVSTGIFEASLLMKDTESGAVRIVLFYFESNRIVELLYEISN